MARKGKLPPIKATPAWPADAIERRLVASLPLICKDEAHQQEVFESLAGEGHDVRVVVT